MTDKLIRELLNLGMSLGSAQVLATLQEQTDALAANLVGGAVPSPWPLTGDVSADRHTITDLAEPSADQDAATKAYVDSGPVSTATVNLSAAQILAIHDTPVEIVPAPGAGKAIAVINIAAALNFATTPYETGEDLDVTYDGDSNTLVPGLFAAFLTADASGGGEFVTAPQRSAAFVGLLTAVEDRAIVATCLTANPENGDSDVFVTVLYYVVDLT